jgi:hypothetical protein
MSLNAAWKPSWCPQFATPSPAAFFSHNQRPPELKAPGAAFEKAFIVEESGARFADGFIKGAEFMMRVDSRNPSVTVPW